MLNTTQERSPSHATPQQVQLRLIQSRSGELLPGMIGQSQAMVELARVVRRTARLDVPALLRGESGSGKELAARALHALSPRDSGPFVAINGATLSESFAASALFGHVRGAFTGAHNPRAGAFRRADGGTLFIDEIAAVPQPSQALLLRALEDLVVTPVGGDVSANVDVRLVTATCEDLERAVGRGLFRADLYQRIATCIVRIPPLRKRRADLRALAEAALEHALPGATLAPGATSALEQHPFPGNVRELRNIMLQAAIHAEPDVITAEHIADVVTYRGGPAPVVSTPDLTDQEALELLVRTNGNISRAARLAGLPRSTFRDRIRRARRDLGEGEGVRGREGDGARE